MTRDTETGETTSKRTRTRLSFDASFSREERTQQGGKQESRKGTVRLLDRGEISYPPPKLAVEDALRFIDAQQGRTRTRQRLPTRR